jgi:hypothetical protein
VSKHQYVEDGKVYEADSDNNTVKEIGTVNSNSNNMVEDFVEGIIGLGESAAESVVDILPDNKK